MSARQTCQMCPIGADFNRRSRNNPANLPHPRKVSSIMSAKLLSIMRAGEIGLTSLFKRFPHRVWQAPHIDREHNPGGGD